MGLSTELRRLCELPVDGEINTLDELRQYYECLQGEVNGLPEEDQICSRLNEIMESTEGAIQNDEWVYIHGAAFYMSRSVTDLACCQVSLRQA